MKSAIRVLFCVLSLSLMATACGGTSAEPEPVAQEPAATAVVDQVAPTDVPVEPTPEPAPTEVPELTADEQVAAAIAEYDSNPLPAGLVGWDHVDAQFLENRVRLEVCTWDGTSIFENLYIAEYRIDAEVDGPSAELLFDGETAGTCQSQALIDSLYAALRDFDNFWAPVLADPTTFDPTVAANHNTPDLVSVSSGQVAGWNAGGLTWRQAVYDGQLPTSAVADVLWRRFLNANGLEILEVLACRPMATDFGLYQGDVLVDDFKNTTSGPHAILIYTVVREEGRWLVDNAASNGYADCFGDRWLEVINEWRPEPVKWEVASDA